MFFFVKYNREDNLVIHDSSEERQKALIYKVFIPLLIEF